MKWLKTIIELGRRIGEYWRALPAEDKAKAKDAARKLTYRVLKRERK